ASTCPRLAAMLREFSAVICGGATSGTGFAGEAVSEDAARCNGDGLALDATAWAWVEVALPVAGLVSTGADTAGEAPLGFPVATADVAGGAMGAAVVTSGVAAACEVVSTAFGCTEDGVRCFHNPIPA